MPLLFLSVAAMGLSTALCIFDELRLLLLRQSHDIRCRKLAVAAFHGCVIFFLLGHLLMEFTGTNRLLTLQQGETVLLVEENLKLTLVAIEDRNLSKQTDSPHIRHLTIELQRMGTCTLARPAMLSPCFFHGLELHVPLYGPPAAEDQARIQIRRNPGLPFLITGVGILLSAVVLYSLAILLRPVKEVRRFNHRENENSPSVPVHL